MFNQILKLTTCFVIGGVLLFSASVLLRGSPSTDLQPVITVQAATTTQTYATELSAPAVSVHFTAPQAGDGGLK